MPAPRRWYFAVPGVLALALLIAHAVSLGIAGDRVEEARTQLWKPGASGELRRLLAQALVSDPRDPAAHALTGIVDAREGRLDDALAHFRESLEGSPSSPYAWANLAMAQYRLGRTGSEFEAALVNASWLGPHEANVQREVAFFALPVWDELHGPAKQQSDAMIGRGMRANPREMLQIAQRRGRLDVVCSHLVGTPRPADSKWTQLCQRGEATP